MSNLGILAFEAKDAHRFTLRAGDREYVSLLEIPELESCRRAAQASLEKLTRTLARRLGHDTMTAAAGWLFTPDYRRPDDFQGLFGWLFLFEVARSLADAGYPKRARLGADVPPWVGECLRKDGFNVQECRPGIRERLRRISLLHNAWQILRFLYRYGIERLRMPKRKGSRPALSGKTVLVKMPLTGAEARYGSLESKLEDAGWTVVPQNFDEEDGSGLPTDWYRLLDNLSLNALAAALKQALKIRRELAMSVAEEDRALAGSPAFSPSLFALARRMLQLALWRRALHAARPHAAVIVTSLTRPEDRMLISILKAHCIPVCQVLPRPLNPDRPAERLLDIDLEYDASLPDLYIVRDLQSLQALREQGIADDRMAIGSTAPGATEQDTSEKSTAPAKAEPGITRILVLLTVLPAANRELCRILAAALQSRSDTQLLIKPHPNLPMAEQERQQLVPLNGRWREASNQPMSELVAHGTIAVTSTSTAAIEAACFGAAVLWAPFLSDINLFQLRFMRQIGHMAVSENALVEHLTELVDKPESGLQLSRQCQEAANQTFGANQSIASQVTNWLDQSRTPDNAAAC